MSKLSSFIKKGPKLTKSEFKREVRSYIIITFFLIVYSVSLVGFVINADIVGGGVNGLATLIFHASMRTLPVGVTSFIINLALLILAFKILGNAFGIKTIYAIFASSFFIGLAQVYLPEPFMGDDVALSVVIGGILVGFSIGTIFNEGGSTGGTDIVALIVNKYRNITPGKVILSVDVAIICSAFLVFYFYLGRDAMDSFRTVVYGFVMMFVTAYVIDMVILGERQSVQLFIFSKKHEEIADMISFDVKRGVTVIKGQGWYTKQESDIVVVLAKKTELQSILHKVKVIDPEAFTSIANVSGVYGKGFDQYRS